MNPVPWKRQPVLRAIAAIGAIFALGRGLPAWYRWSVEQRASAIAAAAQLDRARDLVARRSVIEGRLVAARQRFVALAPALVNGQTASSAASALAALLNGMGAQAGLLMSSVQPTADSSATGMFVVVGVRLSATGDVRGVARFLDRIETERPLLRVRGLSLEQPDPAAPPSQPEALRIQLRVEGLFFRGTM